MTPRLTEAQLALLAEMRERGGVTVERQGRRARTADALRRLGLARVDAVGASPDGTDRWVATVPSIEWDEGPLP